MENTTRQYNVSIFPDLEAGDTPSSTVHMEVAGDFKAFYEDAMNWISAFQSFREDIMEKCDRFRIRDGEEAEDFLVCCHEAEIILSLLYCCENHEVTVREIYYQGNRYTDISDIRFLEGILDERYGVPACTHPIQLHAKKNGRDMLIYIFGPYTYEDYNGAQISWYPLSHGMVEIKEKQMYYAGTYRYHVHEEIWKSYLSDSGDSEDGDTLDDGSGEPRMKSYIQTLDCEKGAEVFLKTDGKNVTFSVLMDGELYKKISKDEEKVIFYSALFNNALLGEDSILEVGSWKHSFWECREIQNVIFEKNGDGEYLYAGRNKDVAERWSGIPFIPPQTPDLGSLDQDSAHRLCQDYIEIFYAPQPAEHSEDRETAPGDKKIWEEYRKILRNIHDKHGVPTSEEEAQAAEILYAACIFFSMEKEELEKFLTTEKLWKQYELLKVSVEDYLKAYADPDEFAFHDIRDVFAQDFSYINQIVSSFVIMGDCPSVSELDDEVRDGTTLEHTAILLLTATVGKNFYKQSASRSMIKYYQAKMAEKKPAEKKKEIDAVIAMKKRLLEGLKARVKGQDMAVEKFVDGYIRYQIRGKVSGKPAGLYLFAGPPGTGKTYLAETFVKLKDLADAGYQFKRFEMAAYGGGSSDAVTGLVGFEKSWKSARPGQLTDFVKKNPKCVLLFDEIEKASAQVRYLFLSVLEGAVLTDKYYDEQVSFEDAIIIFTTNEGKDLYEDNRGTNLTALPDSAVIDGLQASKFAPELISRFLSGTIVMFNHLSYFNMASLFQTSVGAAVDQICRNSLHYDLEYDDKLPKLYLLSKGDRIDARFVSANARKMAEDYFMGAVEYMNRRHPGRLKELKKASVSVEVTDEVRSYFEMTDKPRILGYAEGCAGIYVGETARLRKGFLPKKGLKKLNQIADGDWTKSEADFRECLEKCNWNSRSREDKYDAIWIDFGKDLKKDGAAEGYACLKTAVERKLDIPIIVVDRGAIEEKTSLITLGATDFVQGTLYKPQCMDKGNPDKSNVDSGNQEEKSLALDRGELEAILARQHFVEMAAALVREGRRLSCNRAYEYKRRSRELKLLFTDLCVKAAAEEDAESRRQDRKYLLADRPQVRLRDIFGNKSVKDAVERCIDNIRNPEKYRAAGAKLMTGILMYGAPGMGKTMFAKAMAYESGAAFISAVGADFLNGDGIVKMEEMFRTARRKKPCILFIDEFDAISKNRAGRITNAQENVLEKFLKEMDGLETDNDGVYVVGATNYPLEGLDSAVTRRFSARICFPYPDIQERQKFLLDLLEQRNLKDKISERAVKTLNLMMYRKMRSYSEIKTFIEESIAEALYKKKAVTERFLFNRIHDEMYGASRQEEDPNKYIATAYHEAGHAVLQYHFDRKIDYVTIVSRGNYGGYAMAQLKYDTGQDFLDQICICFAGRVAEMMFMEHISKMGGSMGINIGAGSDLQRATQIAYEYVCRYGLGDRIMVVPRTFASQTGEFPETVLPESEREAIWTSINQILAQQLEVTKQLLLRWWGEVDALARSLVYMQELSGEKAEKVILERIPYVEESCFLDLDNDYKKVMPDGAETMVPFGYPIYPYSQIKAQSEDEDMTGADGRHYFYAVKKAEKGLGLFENLQEAFAAAYQNVASCRRFASKEAAQEYLEMLELKVFRRGEGRFFGFYPDALAEWIDNSSSVKDLIILKGEEIGRYQQKADEAGLPLARYLMDDMAEKFLDEHEDAYRVIQIYDEALQKELLYYMKRR